MRVFVELLRKRVGSPLSLRRYLDVLVALVVVIVVQPWHRNIARSLLQAPKVFFTDS